MDSNLDQPIALRKSKRAAVCISPIKTRAVSDSIYEANTPKTRRSKRVRFSDPSLFTPRIGTTNQFSTGLTPALRRSSLGTPRHQRPATPARRNFDIKLEPDYVPQTPRTSEREQRRIQRDIVSNFQNAFELERKSKQVLQKEIDAKNAELEQLRKELQAAQHKVEHTEGQDGPTSTVEIESTNFDAALIPIASQQQIDETEAELEFLRQSFAAAREDDLPDTVVWDHVPRHQSRKSIQVHEDTDMSDDDATIDLETMPFPTYQPSRLDFRLSAGSRPDADAMRMGLELEAARNHKQDLMSSFRQSTQDDDTTSIPETVDLEFADVPGTSHTTKSTTSRPEPPRMPAYARTELSKQLKATTARAEEAETTLTALDYEIASLGFGNQESDDSLAMLETIQSHFHDVRLELERLAPGEIPAGFDNPQLLPSVLKHISALTTQLRSKESELQQQQTWHTNLKGNFERAIKAAEQANIRAKRLEESLDAQSEDLIHMRTTCHTLETSSTEKDVNISSLTTALNKYRADILRLETLINTLQEEHTTLQSTHTTQTSSLADQITSLETQLSTSCAQITSLESQLHVAQTSLSQSQQIQSTSQADLAAAQAGLTAAHSEISRLHHIIRDLETKWRSEIEAGAAAVQRLQESWVKVAVKSGEVRKRYVNSAKIRYANWELSDGADSPGDDSTVDEEGRRSSSPRTPRVEFAEWADVEVIPRTSQEDLYGAEDTHKDYQDNVDAGFVAGQDVDNDDMTCLMTPAAGESTPGSVTTERGRGRYRRAPKLVNSLDFQRARRRSSNIDLQRMVAEDAEINKNNTDGIDEQGAAGLGIIEDNTVVQGGLTRISKRGKRQYDSGIGINDDDSVIEERNSGLITPELSSEGDGEVERCIY